MATDIDIFDKLNDIISEIGSAAPTTEEELEAFRIKYLGSKNILKPLSGEIRNIPNEKKKDFGLLLNKAKQTAEQKFEAVKLQLEASMDLTAPGEPLELGARHPVALTMNRIIKIFERIGFVVAEEREIEDDWHNFTAMNTPEDHPARDMQDTFYLKGSTTMLLRTHTSSVQARVMTHQQPPIRIIAPGRVYRNETISARSHCQFHQVEGLYIDENVSFADMKQTLLYFAREMFGPDVKIRLRPSFFPFTEPSAELDALIQVGGEVKWVEMGGCGMVDPAVFEAVNAARGDNAYDPDVWSGFAFGFLSGAKASDGKITYDHFPADPQTCVDLGTAHGALAQTTRRDTSMMMRKELEHVATGGGARIVR